MHSIHYRGALAHALLNIDPFAQTYNRNWSMLLCRSAAQNVVFYADAFEAR